MALTSRAGAAAAVSCVLLALAASAAAAGSHSPAPAPAIDCVSAATSLSDCLTYVSPGGASRPSAACCAEVKTAVANPAVVGCLCSLAGNKNLGIPIDMKRVLALPGACGASNAAFSQCHFSGLSPTEAPAPSTAGGSTSGGATASPPTKAAAAGSPMTATALVAAVAAPLLAYCYLF